MKNVFELGRGRFLDSNGDPLNGGQIFFYEPGTSTKKDSYPTKADADAQTNANANPVVLDSGGLPTHAIFLRGDYKVIVTTSGDTDPPAAGLYTIDEINKTEDILDDNGNELLVFVGNSGADDHIQISNADSGNAVKIETVGTSTNVPLSIETKGTGALTIGETSGTNDIDILTGDKSITLDETNDDITIDCGPSTIVMNGSTGAITVDSNAGDTTLTPTGAGTVIIDGLTHPGADGTSGQVLYTDGAATLAFKTIHFTKSASVNFPSSSEDISLFFTDDAVTITQLNAVLVGSSTPSVTFTIRHGTDRSAAGNEVVTSGTTVTSTTTGTEVTSFNDATIPAGSFVWLETTAQSGTVNNLMVTLEYTVD